MRLKFEREIHLQGNIKFDRDLTIFLGVYNGATYLDNLKEQLAGQTSQEFNLLIVDNNSGDNSLSMLKSWKYHFGDRLTLVSNLTNLGAHGSMHNNFDLIKTPWFCQIHQDDYYFGDHIKTLILGINESETDVVAVSTQMGSMAHDGRRIASAPRASMYITEFDQPSSLIQNIRTHCVPDPATAFKTDAFKKSASLWHSTAFPDTEQLLKLCAYGRFKFIPKETMLYRENPYSQSHAIQKSESILETYTALQRFFHSKEFIRIFCMVDDQEKAEFIEGIIDALKYRVTNEVLNSLLNISIIEFAFQLTEYSNKPILELGIPIYESLGFKFPLNLLKNLTGGYANPAFVLRQSDNQRLLKLLTSGQNNGVLLGRRHSSTIRSLAEKLTPIFSRKRIVKLLAVFGVRPSSHKQFDFEWRRSRKEESSK